jgi:N-acetylmuramoyl-L-alanine amidase
MEISRKIAHPSNYTAQDGRKIKYIVVHYTGNNGDTAEGNCNYFAGANRNASAHYFVDEAETWQSVPDKDKAWHCGGVDDYKHPLCRNSNSLGIELCSRLENNLYYFKPETVARAIELVKLKMQEYNIPAENVVRHYDVTGKHCPAPFVYDVEQWAEFKKALEVDEVKVFKTINDVPEWARPTLQKLINDGDLKGDGKGNINVTETFCKTMVILSRRGKL